MIDYGKLLHEESMDIQKESHRTVAQILTEGNYKKSKINVQDATNVFFYRKLAELSLEIKSLNERLSVYENSHK